MDCFIKKIFQDKIDEQVHNQFVRFGRGRYGGRAILVLKKGKKIKLSGSFEYSNDFVLFASDFNVRFSGIILSKEKLDFPNEKKKSNLFVYEVKDLEGKEIKDIAKKAYYMLLDAEGEVDLKIKKRLPKPGKSGEMKIDDKFCVLEAELDKWEKIREAFCWDVPECKKCRIEHSYEINELVIPENEKDFELMRKKTKRKGKIIRKLKIDGREEIKEKEFEA